MKFLNLGTGKWKRRPEVSGVVPFQEPNWTHDFVVPYSLPDETPSSDEEHQYPLLDLGFGKVGTQTHISANSPLSSCSRNVSLTGKKKKSGVCCFTLNSVCSEHPHSEFGSFGGSVSVCE